MERHYTESHLQLDQDFPSQGPPPPVLVKPRALFVENKAEAKNDHTKCEYRVQIFMSKPVYNSHDVLEGQRLRQAEK